MQSKETTISYTFLRRAAFIYTTLPLFCFLLGWLKNYLAIPACLAVLVGLFFALRETKKDDDCEVIRMPRFMPAVIVLSSFLYAFFCGIGRLWAQSKDYPWRNAIFRDLIFRDWPVMYPKYKGALVYYIGQWLPTALPGKLAKLFGAGDDIALFAGNIALLIYITAGLSILFLLLFAYFNPGKNGAMILIILSFIFFSGMDIVASIEPLGANNYHLEWWARDYQYSSFTTCMCWVFNQALIPWICMALLLKEKDVSQYILIGMACLLSGAFPFVGFFIYAITFGVMMLVTAVRNKKTAEFMKALFSPSNILSAILVFPFIGTYLLSNAALSGAGGLTASNAVSKVGETVASVSTETGSTEAETGIGEAIWTYVKFILLEFGVYAILVAGKYKKRPEFYATIIMLMAFPFLRIGYSSDFTMRASIPALFMMYIFCWKYLFEEKGEILINGEGIIATGSKKVVAVKNSSDEKVVERNLSDSTHKGWDLQKLKRYGYALLVICMILGAATPTVEFIRGFRQVSMRGIDDKMTDFLYTLGGDGPYSRGNQGPEYNFVALDLDNQVFFKYFAK